MGMLYYGCDKCGLSIGLMGTFIGFVRCVKCNHKITHDKNPCFTKRTFGCYKCGIKVQFESMDDPRTACYCMRCDSQMQDMTQTKAIPAAPLTK